MADYSRIVLPLDGSEIAEQALPYAKALALRLSVPLRLLLAVEPESPAIVQSLLAGRHWAESESVRAQRGEEYLSGKASSLQEDGLQVETTVPRREPSAAIVEDAARDPDALIAMASHGRSGLARWWMGSVADRVLHTADNPVLIIRAQESPSSSGGAALSRLIVPLDGSELAELALPHVTRLAGAMGLPVTLLQITVSESDYFSHIAIGPGVVPASLPSSPSITELIQMATSEAQGYLEKVRERLVSQGLADVETQVVRGTPADSIVDLATAEEGRLVAMTTHGRSGVRRMVLGSVSERVVRQSGCPVLLVRAGHGD